MATEDYPRRGPEPSGWAVGGMVFAASPTIAWNTPIRHIIVAAIINDEFFVVTRNYAFDLDITGWGWIHLLLGICVAGSGFYLFAGSRLAGYFAIFLASLSAIANFFFIPYYPFWSILVIAIDVWVIWSLTRPGITEP